MIAISSFRPLELSEEYLSNQLRAKASWDTVFYRVVYFNEPCRQMATGRTTFEQDKTGTRPRIKALAEHAAGLSGWVCIINADIVVHPRLIQAEFKLTAGGAQACMSRRWQFEPGHNVETGRVVDLGLDFFAAVPDVWAKFAADVPEDFRLGKIVWDTWALQWFANNLGESFVDITPCKCIFHPRHGGRIDQNLDVPADPYLQTPFKWAAKRLELATLYR